MSAVGQDGAVAAEENEGPGDRACGPRWWCASAVAKIAGAPLAANARRRGGGAWDSDVERRQKAAFSRSV